MFNKIFSFCNFIYMMHKFSHLSNRKHPFGQDLVVCICMTVCVIIMSSVSDKFMARVCEKDLGVRRIQSLCGTKRS